MRKIGIYIFCMLLFTVLIPAILVQVYRGENTEKLSIKRDMGTIQDIDFKDTKKIKIYNVKTKQVQEIGLEEYIVGVVASEMPAAFHEEALKAQAVAARTYALSRVAKFKDGNPNHKEAPLCTSVHCQVWRSKEELVETHGENWIINNWEKLQSIVDNTKGEILTYNGELVSEPLFHSTSGGKTESSEAVFSSSTPYLRSVESPLEEESPRYKETVTMTIQEFISIIKQKYPSVDLNKENIKDKLKIAKKSDTGRIQKVIIDNETMEGTAFRQLFKLNSTNFKIKLVGEKLEIETTGYGHGVGMSQWGANGMAKEGKNYKEILTHYYTDVKVEKI